MNFGLGDRWSAADVALMRPSPGLHQPCPRTLRVAALAFMGAG